MITLSYCQVDLLTGLRVENFTGWHLYMHDTQDATQGVNSRHQYRNSNKLELSYFSVIYHITLKLIKDVENVFPLEKPAKSI